MEAEVRPVPNSCRMSVPLETWRGLGPLENANHILLETKQVLIFYTLYSTAVCIPVTGLVGGVHCNFSFFQCSFSTVLKLDSTLNTCIDNSK